jgi:molybdopterin converting factor small subunit
MSVDVKLYGELENYSPEEGNFFNLELSQGATAADLLTVLSIPDEVQRFILINGKRCEENSLLRDGDTVTVLTPVSRG